MFCCLSLISFQFHRKKKCERNRNKLFNLFAHSYEWKGSKSYSVLIFKLMNSINRKKKNKTIVSTICLFSTIFHPFLSIVFLCFNILFIDLFFLWTEQYLRIFGFKIYTFLSIYLSIPKRLFEQRVCNIIIGLRYQL